MKLFNIGLPELIFVFAIMLIFLGPQGIADNARKLGRSIRKIMSSEAWKTFMGTYKEVKQYPSQLMKELELEEADKDFKKDLREIEKMTNDEIQTVNKVMDKTLSEPLGDIKEASANMNKTNNEINRDLSILNHVEVKNNSSVETVKTDSSELPK